MPLGTRTALHAGRNQSIGNGIISHSVTHRVPAQSVSDPPNWPAGAANEMGRSRSLFLARLARRPGPFRGEMARLVRPLLFIASDQMS